MTTSYLPYDPQQQLLLPQALQEWLPEGHLAYFISDTIDALDLSAFHARYAGGGPRNQPFHPALMVKILVYGYATGVFSSRKLARKLHEDVAFRVLAAGNYPAHRTLCDFRALHLNELAGLFVQVVKLARECGLVTLGTIAVDGTKIKANASRHKAMSYERMKQAEQGIDLGAVHGDGAKCDQAAFARQFDHLHEQAGQLSSNVVHGNRTGTYGPGSYRQRAPRRATSSCSFLASLRDENTPVGVGIFQDLDRQSRMKRLIPRPATAPAYVSCPRVEGVDGAADEVREMTFWEPFLKGGGQQQLLLRDQ